MLMLTALSPLDATGIGFATRITPVPANAPKAIALTIRFDPHTIQFTPSGNAKTADIQYAVFEFDDTGKIIGGEDKPFNIEVSQAAYEAGLKEGMAISLTEPLLGQASDLCIVLRDNNTGTAGSLRISLEKYHSGAKTSAKN